MSPPDIFQSIPIAEVKPEPRWALALINAMLDASAILPGDGK
jgi:hypothetical protein